MPHFVFAPGDLDIWPSTPNSNSGDIFVKCT